jgi:hypothetical protein
MHPFLQFLRRYVAVRFGTLGFLHFAQEARGESIAVILDQMDKVVAQHERSFSGVIFDLAAYSPD